MDAREFSAAEWPLGVPRELQQVMLRQRIRRRDAWSRRTSSPDAHVWPKNSSGRDISFPVLPFGATCPGMREICICRAGQTRLAIGLPFGACRWRRTFEFRRIRARHRRRPHIDQGRASARAPGWRQTRAAPGSQLESTSRSGQIPGHEIVCDRSLGRGEGGRVAVDKRRPIKRLALARPASVSAG
jgi:hypothetical protein